MFMFVSLDCGTPKGSTQAGSSLSYTNSTKAESNKNASLLHKDTNFMPWHTKLACFENLSLFELVEMQLRDWRYKRYFTLDTMTILIMTLLITLNTGDITYNDITYNWFYL